MPACQLSPPFGVVTVICSPTIVNSESEISVIAGLFTLVIFTKYSEPDSIEAGILQFMLPSELVEDDIVECNVPPL